LNVLNGIDSYRVCELLYEQRREYDKILHCYLRDPLRKPQVFSYLRNILLLYTSATDRARVELQITDSIQVTASCRLPLVCTTFNDRAKVATQISDYNVSFLSLILSFLSLCVFYCLPFLSFYLSFFLSVFFGLFISLQLLFFPLSMCRL
jgi:hypothetical protein